MEGHHHHHHQYQQQQYQYHQQQQQQQQQQQPPPSSVSVDADRFPQWSIQETKEFLMIRAELDRSFMETNRNKLLWEVISTRMREMGFNRSAEQCKCKWKNLVTRYKGCETMEEEAMRQQFPFYSELQAIFSTRIQSILRSESERGATGSKRKAVQLSSDEEEDTEEKELEKSSVRKKKQGKTGGGAGIGGSTSGNSNNSNNIKEILEDFMRQQMQMEMQWREAFEAREKERRLKEMEWRQKMEALETERILMDRRWYEREEQRRMREEARAEKRDALITALLNKLRRDDHM